MKNETARREIESLDYYLQNHTDDYSEESHTAMMMAIKALETLEEFEKAQIITGGRLNGRTYAYKCGLEDGQRKALEQESESKQFAEWVAEEIFDDYWEWNEDAFAELACRKLAKLGIVRAKGDEWELIEPQESEDKE